MDWFLECVASGLHGAFDCEKQPNWSFVFALLPRGYVPAHGSRSAESLRVFTRLGVPSSLVDEVYCAAFLSCWLCTFVLPFNVTGSIRPSIFKMASYMATGKIVSLAIPVLASIYRGLHLITTSRYPSNSGCCFPVHYLLGWVGAYLRTYIPIKRYPPVPSMVRYSGVDRCNLRVAWAELCLFVEGKSHMDLLVEEGGIMANFEALMKFSRQDLSRQGEELKAVFSAPRDVRDAQCSVIPSEVHDRLPTIRAASTESYSKLEHEMEAIGSIRTSLQQSEERAIRFRQELNELDVRVEDLRR
ncbi:hypothetical protein LIER_15598 [Lithospermum erythrorhizon]|uniref:Aminotransferase-like plant mobile domain-containing protein n=1 Tax=Lithospermum erythrorhizon TaxID=34254 RepID=A0AAV3Q652_LITER